MWLCCQIVATRGVRSSKTVCFQRLPGFAKLFVFDGARRLGRAVIEHAVDALDLARDARGQLVEQRPVEVLDRGGHGVAGVHGADDDGPGVGALAVGDAGGGEVGHDGEILPDLAGETGLRELLAEDRIGLAHGLEPVARDRADAADAETGAGERLTIHHLIRQAERLADDADLVLEEDAHGLDEFKAGGDILRQAAGVVVRLDAGLALEDVRPDGTLREAQTRR